jgi:hypothetical protein
MAAVQFCRNHHGQILPSPSRLHARLIGHCPDQIATQRDEALDPPVEQPFDGIDNRHPVVLRRFKAKQVTQFVHRHQFGLFGDTDSALPLDVGMAAHRAAPGTKPPYIAAQQQQVDQHRDVQRAMGMLRQTHAINADHRFGLDIDLCRLAQRGLGQAA